ncbi:Cytochrome P450 2D9 [Anabarilius grahami]|uniref:Cytochrome P450 2D9 n=1 Tax=Anabarilius grahami TaxID=495550 RepID=A0A3N0Z156_ANAGA|nr:Cytochrome P450 2D9 [Anabarilius grahami]
MATISVVQIGNVPEWFKFKSLFCLTETERQQLDIKGIVNPQNMFHNVASNVIGLVLFGTRFDYNNEFLQRYVQLITEVSKMLNGPWNMRKNDGSTFSDDQLIMNILDLHFAGTDTTSNTLLTAFLYLMNHPEVQEEGQWKFPHEFNPANFLNEQGQFEKPEAFIPFSIGPRVCLGEGLARMELFLVFVTLLHRFQFVWPDDAGEPDYTPVYGITMTTKPYRMHIKCRQTVKL